jgi:hypothetical protein
LEQFDDEVALRHAAHLIALGAVAHDYAASSSSTSSRLSRDNLDETGATIMMRRGGRMG